jgi:hypothetical protein
VVVLERGTAAVAALRAVAILILLAALAEQCKLTPLAGKAVLVAVRLRGTV